MIYVLHHMDSDGRFGGHAAWRYFVEKFQTKDLNDKVVFKEVQYGQSFPIEYSDLTEKDEVYIIDFSYSRVILDEVYPRVEKLVVLDHHETAEEQLRGTPYGHFDKTKSGALIAWNYFFPDEEAPFVCLLVNDYDLWQKQYEPDTSAFEAWLQFERIGQDWEHWHKLATDVNYLREVVHGKGKVLHEQNVSIVDAFVKNKGNYFISNKGVLKNKPVPFYRYVVYNGNTILRNEIAEELYTKFDLDITVQWRLRGDRFLFSVRAPNPEKVSASQFCSQFADGGGNPKAGGFALPMDEGYALIKFLMEI